MCVVCCVRHQVAPGKPAADDQAAANERKQTEGGVVAGDQRQVTGNTHYSFYQSQSLTYYCMVVQIVQ